MAAGIHSSFQHQSVERLKYRSLGSSPVLQIGRSQLVGFGEKSSEAAMVDRSVRCSCCIFCEKRCGSEHLQDSSTVKSSNLYEEVRLSKKLMHIPREKISASGRMKVASAEGIKQKKVKKDSVMHMKNVWSKKYHPEKRSLWSLNGSLTLSGDSNSKATDDPVNCKCCVACEKNCGDSYPRDSSTNNCRTMYEKVDPSKKLRHIPCEEITNANLTSTTPVQEEKKAKGDVTLVKDVFPDDCRSSATHVGDHREKRSLWSLNDSLIRERLFVSAKKEKVNGDESEYEDFGALDFKKLKHIKLKNGEFVKSTEPVEREAKRRKSETNEFLTLEDIRKMEEDYLKQKKKEGQGQVARAAHKTVKSGRKKGQKGKRKAVTESGTTETGSSFAESSCLTTGTRTVFNSASDSSGLERSKKSSKGSRKCGTKETRLTDSENLSEKNTNTPKSRERCALWSLLCPEDRKNLYERPPNLRSPPTEYERIEKPSKVKKSPSDDGEIIGSKRGEFYIGAHKKEIAEQLCRRRKTFRFYHRIPSKSFVFDYTLIPDELIVWIVYRTRKGYYRHFPVVVGGKSQKWSIANFPNSLRKFDSFNALIKYYMENWTEIDDSL
ncbi:hypothetical protein QR680_007344 [Steinernema hermaphroditum]|uniref:Uncharacterized protein n=1 Tax=Steinernema hermaphroditum TaxID=289476 RepID=A0AA39IEH8_9BILA|nr:hypothetical protein QR680_007344 [Steinernema hermaphroditum]